MTTTVVVSALVTAAANLLAGAVGAWAWYRVTPSRGFWVLLRIGQAAAVVVAVEAGALAAAGRASTNKLFYLYALLPVGIGLIAEQLRLTSAETVLASRGLADARAVGELPEHQQRSVVLAIVRREIGIMALAALVVCFLEVRGAGTAHGL
ncbi:MAG TPA: hypothetical protein VGY97_07260 [Solirubrobacteraceae bacterium]|nr:hypothetical protein [Solirubrobacteraceae bacterium]